MIAVYVDDIIIILAGRSHARIKEEKGAIADKFMAKGFGKLHNFLGVKLIDDKDRNNIWIGQEMYPRELIKKLKVEQSNTTSILSQMGSNLVQAVDKEIYQLAVGSQLYLYTRTRPDISKDIKSFWKTPDVA